MSEKTKTLYLRQKLGGTFIKQTVDDAFLDLMITMYTVNEVVIEKFLKNCDHTPVFNKMAISHPELCGNVLEAYKHKQDAEETDHEEARGRFNTMEKIEVPF